MENTPENDPEDASENRKKSKKVSGLVSPEEVREYAPVPREEAKEEPKLLEKLPNWYVRYELEARLNHDISFVIIEIKCRDEARAREIADDRRSSMACKKVQVLKKD